MGALLDIARQSAAPDQPSAREPSDALPDPAAEARRQRVLAKLVERPGVRYAVLTDTEADQKSVILALAIRDVGTCELHVPRAKFDPFVLLDLIERHGATVH